ncbi:MAG: extracellular solute-binding protein [Candidatus Ornithospirochaeta sp.]|nr:extracellular solute-binding protein [Candidatus Ornithospirochaeta sp.]
MKKGKTFILIMLTLLSVGLLFANGSAESAKQPAVDTSKYQLKDPQPTLKMLMSPSTFDYNERPEAKEIEQLTGYHVEYYRLPSENTEQALALSVAAGNDYDAIQFSNPSSFSSLMSSGALLRLNDYIENMCPEFFDVMPAEYWSGVSDAEGNIYGLPYMHPRKTNILSNFIVRMDLVRAAGINELPTTLDGFYDMLKTLKNYYGDQYIILTGPFWRKAYGNMYPVDMCLASAFGIYNDWMVDENGKVIYMTEHPRFKELIAFYNRLYDEGILDKDFAINSYKDVNERVSSGKAIIAFNSTTSGVNTVYPALLKMGLTDDDIAFIGPLEDDGVCTVQNTVSIERYTVIPKNNRGNVANTFDWFKKKLENQHEFTIGVEGVHYTVDEKGYPTPIQPIFNDLKNQGYVFLTLADYNMYAQDWLLRAKKTYYYWRLYEEVTIKATEERPWIFVPAYFALCNTEAYMKNQGTLTTQLNDYILQIITGTKPVDSTMKTFMADQKNEGLEDVRAELQVWYDRNYKNK